MNDGGGAPWTTFLSYFVKGCIMMDHLSTLIWIIEADHCLHHTYYYDGPLVHTHINYSGRPLLHTILIIMMDRFSTLINYHGRQLVHTILIITMDRLSTLI